MGDGGGGEGVGAEVGRHATVAGPAVHAGVGVPLEEVDVGFDGAEGGGGGQEASLKVGDCQFSAGVAVERQAGVEMRMGVWSESGEILAARTSP